MLKTPQHPKKKISAQAMVEFALALPILLLVVYGLLETGRLIFIYASVVTAARNAARYGAASGDIGSGTLFYNDCTGIRAAANKVAFLQRFNSIVINYDTGPGTTQHVGCPISPAISDNDHRIDVTVSAQFTPIVPLVPFRPFTITSTSNRTIITGVSVAVTQISPTLSPGGGALNVTKTGSPNTFSGPNQTINYTYLIINPTSDPITSIVLTDDKISILNCPGGIPFDLAGGASITCTGTYVTTIADVNAAQPITNNSNAVGLDITGATVIGGDDFTVDFVGAPQMRLTKSGVAPTRIEVGQSVQYTFTLENIGNVPLTAPFTIVDNLIGSNWTCPAGPLAVGGTLDCHGTYVLKNADINRGYVDNTAHATGKFASTTVTSNTSSAHVIVPELAVLLTANKASVSAVGEKVDLTYTVTNRTGGTVTNIAVTDDHQNASHLPIVCPTTTLAAGASMTCTSTYTVNQTDFDSSTVLIITATVNGRGVTPNSSGVTITLVQNPVLQLTKTASPAAPPSGTTFLLPQNITYTYTLKNTGNVTLRAPFSVTDDKLGTICSVASGSIGPGASLAPCTQTYPLKQADLDAGSVINTATAHATFLSQPITSGQVTAMVITYTLPRMALVKTANVTFFTAANQTITYTYTLRNTGGVVLAVSNPYVLNDNKLGNLTCGVVGNLPIGGSVICKTASYTTSQADVTARSITNTVSAASGSTNPATNPSPASLTIPLFVCDITTVRGSGIIADGTDRTWTITNNSGLPIHISAITVTWTGSSPPPKLSQVFLNGLSIFAGAGNSPTVLPNAPWLLNNGASPMRLTFSSTANSIRVLVGFSESSCNFFLDSNQP